MLDLNSLDLEEIANALADQNDYEHRWLTAPHTGGITFWMADTGIDGQTPVDLDELDLVVIEPLPSWVWYQDMADFAEASTDERARRRLGRVIQGKGAFRRFKDELHEEYPSTNSTAATREAMHLAELLATAGGLDHDHPERTAAPRPPRTAKAAAFWVRQLNPSARTTAPGTASRSRGSRARSAQASLTSPWLTWKPKLPARPQQPVSRCSAWASAAASSFSSASQPGTACWCQCTWVSTGRWTAAGVYPGVCSVSSSDRVSVWSRSRSTRQSSRQQVVEHSESTRLHGRNRRRPGRRRGGPRWALIRAGAAGEAAPVHQESAAYCAGGGTGVAVILI